MIGNLPAQSAESGWNFVQHTDVNGILMDVQRKGKK